MADTSLPPIKEKKKRKDADDDMDPEQQEAFHAKNWGFFKKDEYQIKKLAPQLKSRYLAYEEPSKLIVDAQLSSKKRLLDLKKKHIRQNQPPSDLELDEKDKHEKLIGQLKAAEARNRIRIMRLRYEANRAQEINHLTACQPTARKAVRMQALLPVRPEDRSQGDSLDKLSRSRVEALLEDAQGILISRS